MAGNAVTNPTAAGAPARRSIVTVDDLSLSFRSGGASTPVLSGIDLRIDAGDFVAIFGPSGAGKSTLLRAVAGLVAPDSGSVRFNAHHLTSNRPFGFVFQDPRLLPWRSVAKNVEFGLEGSGMTRADRGERAAEMLSLVGLSGHGGRWPKQLSGGQRQRVGIARALAVRPDVMLMDEPFSSLDAITRGNLQDELLRIWRATGTSILFVTHDLEEAVRLADRLVLLAGAPARVEREYRIDSERPRDPSSDSVQTLLREVRWDLKTASQHGR